MATKKQDDEEKEEPAEDADWVKFKLPPTATTIAFGEVTLPSGEVLPGREYHADKDGVVRLHPEHHGKALQSGAVLVDR